MEIYFVRHGETSYNRRGLHQSPDVPLSNIGRVQIEKTAERLKAYGATKLITSDLTRAYQSAEIIGKATGLDPKLSVLFREVRRPSSLHGTRHFGLSSLQAMGQICLHLHNKDWHYSDEENLYDLKARTMKAVEYLKELGKEHEKVIIVSHAFIINIFLKYMCKYNDVRVRDYLKTFIAAKRLKNGSISTVAYNDDHNEHTCDWLCVHLNDTRHL